MMALLPGSSSGARVYVGDLPKNASEEELENVFKEYGSIRDIWVARNPPGFAFVSYDTLEDAEEAVKALNGSTICGVRARVEHSSEPYRGRSQSSRHSPSRSFPPPPVFPYPPMDYAARPELELWRRHFQTILPFLMTKPSPAKIYVGDLSKDASEKELQRIFSVYGPLRDVWVARNPPGFAFIEFVSFQDADDAVQKLNGTIICGQRVRVEHSTERAGRSRGPAVDPLMDFRPPFDIPYPLRAPWPDLMDPRDEDGVPSKVFVGNLPKDACRRELEVVFRLFGPLRDVWIARNPPGFAFVEFYNFRDADEAVRRMDGELICGIRARVEHSNSMMEGAVRHRRPRSRQGGRSRSRTRSRSRYRTRRRRSTSSHKSSSSRSSSSRPRRRRRSRRRSSLSSRSRSSSSSRPRGRMRSFDKRVSKSRSSSSSRPRRRMRSVNKRASKPLDLSSLTLASLLKQWSSSQSSSGQRWKGGEKRTANGSSRVYVGGISKYTTSLELENVFRDYGSLNDVWVARNPPGFAFVDFRNFKDADAAVKAMDGSLVFGRHIRVEHSTKKTKHEKSEKVSSKCESEDGEVNSTLSGSMSSDSRRKDWRSKSSSR